MEPKRNQTDEAYMLSWAKKKEIGSQGFKEEEDNSQENEKSRYLTSEV